MGEGAGFGECGAGGVSGVAEGGAGEGAGFPGDTGDGDDGGGDVEAEGAGGFCGVLFPLVGGPDDAEDDVLLFLPDGLRGVANRNTGTPPMMVSSSRRIPSSSSQSLVLTEVPGATIDRHSRV